MNETTMIVVEPCELRAWRHRLGLLQEELAERSCVAPNQISRIERFLTGNIKTYKKLNTALRAIEQERTQSIA
jgi:transcriptional regulator with XRE-family HTH domain